MSRVDVGLCLPVLNEREALGHLLDEIEASLAGGRYTICVIDDGSADGTRELVQARADTDDRVVLLQGTKSGPGCRRGGASRVGLSWLLANRSHPFYADIDADGANRPEEIARGIAV